MNSSRLVSACALTIRLAMIVAVLSLVCAASASADCRVGVGHWQRGADDDIINHRIIDGSTGDICYKLSYTGFDEWGGVVDISAPISGDLRCGYLVVDSPSGWAYKIYGSLMESPCQDSFKILIRDVGGYVTTAVYTVYVNWR